MYIIRRPPLWGPHGCRRKLTSAVVGQLLVVPVTVILLLSSCYCLISYCTARGPGPEKQDFTLNFADYQAPLAQPTPSSAIDHFLNSLPEASRQPDGNQRTPKPPKMSLKSGPKTIKNQESVKKLKCLKTSIFAMFQPHSDPGLRPLFRTTCITNSTSCPK